MEKEQKDYKDYDALMRQTRSAREAEHAIPEDDEKNDLPAIPALSGQTMKKKQIAAGAAAVVAGAVEYQGEVIKNVTTSIATKIVNRIGGATASVMTEAAKKAAEETAEEAAKAVVKQTAEQCTKVAGAAVVGLTAAKIAYDWSTSKGHSSTERAVVTVGAGGGSAAVAYLVPGIGQAAQAATVAYGAWVTVNAIGDWVYQEEIADAKSYRQQAKESTAKIANLEQTIEEMKRQQAAEKATEGERIAAAVQQTILAMQRQQQAQAAAVAGVSSHDQKTRNVDGTNSSANLAGNAIRPTTVTNQQAFFQRNDIRITVTPAAPVAAAATPAVVPRATKPPASGKSSSSCSIQ